MTSLEEVNVIDLPTAAPKTPTEIIDDWLTLARHRSLFDSSDVVDMLLDIRSALGADS
jgi:hypothetical protein